MKSLSTSGEQTIQSRFEPGIFLIRRNTPLIFCKRDLVPPLTHTDTDDYIIMLYVVPLIIVSNLMMA